MSNPGDVSQVKEILTEPLIQRPSMPEEGYDIGQLIEKAGGFGRCQWLLLLFCVLSYQGLNFFVYNLAYLELMPAMECMYTGTTEFVKCFDKKDICSKDTVLDWRVDYTDKKSYHNWMTDHNLYCESGFTLGMFGSLFFLGFAINGIILKQSDVIGRKNLIVIGSALHIICCYMLYFSDNYRVYFVLMLIAGLLAAKNMCLYIYITETVPVKYQMMMGCVCFSLDPFIAMIPTSLYFYLGGKYWKTIFSPVLVLPVISFAASLFIPESPRYLYARKKFTELRESLKTIAFINGANMLPFYGIDEELKMISKKKPIPLIINEVEGTLSSEEEQEEEYSVFKDLQNKTTLANFLVVCMCFSVVSFNYYLISFYMKYVGGNIFINTIASTISEAIGNFVAGMIQKKMGTKKSFIICFAASVFFALPLLYITQESFIAICVFSSKFFVEGAFCLAYYVNSEVFPPLFVPFSFSVCGLLARMVTISAPQVAELQPRQLPIVAFLLFSGLAGAGAAFLRKPREQKISDDI